MSHSSKTKSPQSANTVAVNNLPEHFTTFAGTIPVLEFVVQSPAKCIPPVERCAPPWA